MRPFLAFTLLLFLPACVESQHNFDDIENAFYGCTQNSQCSSPDDSTPYVCCFDALPSDAPTCEGRCIPQTECPEPFQGDAFCAER